MLKFMNDRLQELSGITKVILEPELNYLRLKEAIET